MSNIVLLEDVYQTKLNELNSNIMSKLVKILTLLDEVTINPGTNKKLKLCNDIIAWAKECVAENKISVGAGVGDDLLDYLDNNFVNPNDLGMNLDKYISNTINANLSLEDKVYTIAYLLDITHEEYYYCYEKLQFDKSVVDLSQLSGEHYSEIVNASSISKPISKVLTDSRKYNMLTKDNKAIVYIYCKIILNILAPIVRTNNHYRSEIGRENLCILLMAILTRDEVEFTRLDIEDSLTNLIDSSSEIAHDLPFVCQLDTLMIIIANPELWCHVSLLEGVFSIRIVTNYLDSYSVIDAYLQLTASIAKTIYLPISSSKIIDKLDKFIVMPKKRKWLVDMLSQSVGKLVAIDDIFIGRKVIQF